MTRRWAPASVGGCSRCGRRELAVLGLVPPLQGLQVGEPEDTAAVGALADAPQPLVVLPANVQAESAIRVAVDDQRTAVAVGRERTEHAEVVTDVRLAQNHIGQAEGFELLLGTFQKELLALLRHTVHSANLVVGEVGILGTASRETHHQSDEGHSGQLLQHLSPFRDCPPHHEASLHIIHYLNIKVNLKPEKLHLLY